MLLSTLRTFLKPYRGQIVAVIGFQLLATVASLYLPTLNARIIDEGVAQGDTAAIWNLGMIMLGVTVLQIVGLLGAGARCREGQPRDLVGLLGGGVGRDREAAARGRRLHRHGHQPRRPASHDPYARRHRHQQPRALGAMARCHQAISSHSGRDPGPGLYANTMKLIPTQLIAISTTLDGETFSMMVTVEQAEAMAKGDLIPMRVRHQTTGKITIALADPMLWSATGCSN